MLENDEKLSQNIDDCWQNLNRKFVDATNNLKCFQWIRRSSQELHKKQLSNY
jgi:hypothetical protein